MVKHTQTIRWLMPANCLSVFDRFMGSKFKGLKYLNTTRFFSDIISVVQFLQYLMLMQKNFLINFKRGTPQSCTLKSFRNSRKGISIYDVTNLIQRLAYILRRQHHSSLVKGFSRESSSSLFNKLKIKKYGVNLKLLVCKV